jgi:energy-converting hydrogenase A subunit M
MAVSVVNMRRCEHIRTNGTQCGSPAQREKKRCYQHLRVRPERVKVRGGDGKTSEIVVPLLEDAHSIQMMVRQAMVLMLRGRIEGEMAGRLLYALQIASANLERMREEAPRPVQVVVDVERVGETPLGMTPWSGKAGGHEPEEVEDKVVARTKRAILEERENERRAVENRWMKRQLSQITEKMESYGEEVEEWIAKDDATVDGLKHVVQNVKQKMEEVADANLHHCTLEDVTMLTREEEEEWRKERERRNTSVAREVREVMKRCRG